MSPPSPLGPHQLPEQSRPWEFTSTASPAEGRLSPSWGFGGGKGGRTQGSAPQPAPPPPGSLLSAPSIVSPENTWDLHLNEIHLRDSAGEEGVEYLQRFLPPSPRPPRVLLGF